VEEKVKSDFDFEGLWMIVSMLKAANVFVRSLSAEEDPGSKFQDQLDNLEGEIDQTVSDLVREFNNRNQIWGVLHGNKN
jgi:hypothetical protein